MLYHNFGRLIFTETYNNTLLRNILLCRLSTRILRLRLIRINERRETNRI